MNDFVGAGAGAGAGAGTGAGWGTGAGAGSGTGAGWGTGAGAGWGSGARAVFGPRAISPRAGPPPESVALAAKRLAGLAGDLDAVRMALGSVAVQDWRSPAAAVFREAVAGLTAELAAAVQAVDSASDVVGRYGMALRDQLEAESCASPLAQEGAMRWGF